MNWRSKATLALLLGLAIAALVPPLAPGDAGQRTAGAPDCSGSYPPRFCKFTSLIFYTQEKGRPFRGKIIRAGSYACERHRTVKVFRYGGDRLVGKTKTNDRNHSRWFIPRQNRHGSFYAKVVPAWRRSGGGNHVDFCGGDTSRTHTFD